MTRDECRKKSRPPRALRAALRGRGRARRTTRRSGDSGSRAARCAARTAARSSWSTARGGTVLGQAGVPLARGAARAAGARRARGPGDARSRRPSRRSLAAGARAIVAITAGLGESSADGRPPRSRPSSSAFAPPGAVLLGPNCLGVVRRRAELDLASSDFVPGPIGLISQSGNLAIEVSLLGRGGRPRHLPLRLAREPGRPRRGRARRRARRARRPRELIGV